MVSRKGASSSFSAAARVLAPHGECVAVVGPSGSGKTTLLRVIAGLLPPLAGEIHCVANSAASRSAIGYIPQNVGLVKNRTALQNVLLGALGRLSGWRSLLGSFPTSERKAADEDQPA